MIRWSDETGQRALPWTVGGPSTNSRFTFNNSLFTGAFTVKGTTNTSRSALNKCTLTTLTVSGAEALKG